MRWPLAIGCALFLFSVRAEPVEALPSSSGNAKQGSPSTSSGRTAEGVDAVATKAGFAGELLVAQGERVLLDKGYGPIAPEGGSKHHARETWRLASISKQIFAAIAMRIAQPRVDDPLGARLSYPAVAEVTLRQLLTHHSGLADPDDTTVAGDDVPAFYRKPKPDLAYCVSKHASPGAAFHYNNCDYVVASAAVFGDLDSPKPLFPSGTHMAGRGERGVPGYVHGRPEPAFELASWGAAGGLIGTAPALLAFDRSLMTGKLLPPAALAELWKPEGHGSYQALGQWVFPGQLRGCAAPKRIVQRDGEIYGVQARNFIFPDDDLVVILFTNRSSDDFKLGEVWEGKGFVYDLLSAAACP